MCQRVGFIFAGMPVGSAFDSATRALLPVRKRSGRDELVLWGRKDGEPGDSELVPVIAAESVRNGDWEMYKPRWVKLFVQRFRLPDADGVQRWHALPPGAFIQGVLIKDTDERQTRRVYIASIAAPRQCAGLSHDGRWPHVSDAHADDEATRPSSPNDDSDIY